jgi:Ion channel
MKLKTNSFFEGVLNKERSFSFLLCVLLLYLFIIIPLLTNTTLSKFAFIIFYYLLLSSSIPFLRQNKMTILIFILVLGPLIFLTLEIIFSASWLPLLTDILLILYCLMLATIILWRIFEPGRITGKPVQGALISYLLIGLIFGLLFHVIHLLNTTKCFNGLSSDHRKEFIYYSFCTITTDGYGDITPYSAVARSLSNLEALVGQLYPAVLIARLISLEFYYKKIKVKTE